MTKARFRVLFEGPNGDDPLEPDCSICCNQGRCRHKNTPCTFDMLIEARDD